MATWTVGLEGDPTAQSHLHPRRLAGRLNPSRRWGGGSEDVPGRGWAWRGLQTTEETTAMLQVLAAAPEVTGIEGSIWWLWRTAPAKFRRGKQQCGAAMLWGGSVRRGEEAGVV